MKKTVLFIIFIFLGQLLKAQDALPGFIAPAPDTYALGKYGDIPVGYYTGTPQIDVPLWTLNDGDISVPISLSYHASGIKVDEIASSVGLGWSLNAGGVITRIIRDFPDSPNLSGTGLNGSRMDDVFKWYSDYQVDNTTYDRNTNYLNMLEEMHGWDNGIDNEADIFYYNFNGKSGKFFFNNNGVPCLYKHENIKIEWSKESDIPGQENIKFTVTDEYGNIYEFNNREKTFFEGMGQQVTAWYLSKITSPKGNSITFSYREDVTQNHIRLPKEEIIPVSSNTSSGNLVNSNVIVQDMGHTELKLEQITASNGSSASFIPDQQNPRLDYPSAYPTYALKEIMIKNMDDEPERIFALNTTYFVASTQNSQYNHLNYRLKLDGITEYSGDRGQSKMMRSFDYFGDDASETALRLPYRLSPSQDYWGYFNGASNTGLLPGKAAGIYIGADAVYNWIVGSSGNYSGAINNGADREPDEQSKKACVLKRINYPTGGFTEFDYESHKSGESDVAGLRVLKITDKTESAPAVVTNYSYSGPCLPVPFDSKSNFSYFTAEDDYTRCIYATYVTNLVRQVFAFPSDALFPGKCVKVTANPQAVLNGAESDLGYGTVNVSKTGQGRTVYSYADPARFPDYESLGDGFGIEDLFQVQLLDYKFTSCAIMPSDGFDISILGGIYSTKDWPHLPVYSNAWERSILLSMEVYAEGGSTPIHKEIYDYYTENTANIAGYKLGEYDKIYHVPGHDYPYKNYLVAKYYVPYNWIALKEKHVFDNFAAGTVEKVTQYTYNDDAYRLLNKTVTTNSAGKTIETSYKYPSDINGIYDGMETINMINYPIEQTTMVESGVVNSSLSTFKLSNGHYVPDKVFSLETSVPLSSFTTFNGTDKDNRYGVVPELSFENYDDRENILSAAKKDGSKVSYLWGYNQTLPIAQVINAENTLNATDTAEQSTGTNAITFGGAPGVSTTSTFTVDYTGKVTLRLGVNGTPSFSTVVDYGGITGGSATLAKGGCGLTEVIFNNVSAGTHTLTLTLTTPDSGVPSLGACGEVEYSKYNTVTQTSGIIGFLYENFEESTQSGVVEDASMAHTGKKYYQGDYTVNFTLSNARNYIIEYWYLDANSQWQYIMKPYASSSMTLTEGSAIDDVRIYPSDAQMTTYTYDPLIGMTSATDAAGKVTRYEYDDLGRLKQVKDDENYIVKHYDYNYKNAGAQP